MLCLALAYYSTIYAFAPWKGDRKTLIYSVVGYAGNECDLFFVVLVTLIIDHMNVDKGDCLHHQGGQQTDASSVSSVPSVASCTVSCMLMWRTNGLRMDFVRV